MDIVNYLTEKSLHLVPALYVIGAFMKNTPFVPDWLIPWVLTVLGIIGGCASVGVSYDGVFQGILATGATVLGDQLLKQTFNKNEQTLNKQ